LSIFEPQFLKELGITEANGGVYDGESQLLSKLVGLIEE